MYPLIKAYHLNHLLLSLYAFEYLHYSVILSSRRWNPFPGVCSDLDLCWQIYAQSKNFRKWHLCNLPLFPGLLESTQKVKGKYHEHTGKVP